ncbi:hypothetical protein HUJ05_001681 [Dendroctonus ponderosae]|nr:hypothetical protein HUJ05_001681 [Dendroctonus ponderosae]
MQNYKGLFSEPTLTIISIKIEEITKNKQDILSQLCQTTNCDILCIQETHRDENSSSPDVTGMNLSIETPHNKYGKHAKKFLTTRTFRQVALEFFFGCIRSYRGRKNTPSASHFESSFKALITNNFISSHSPGANCKEDESEGALKNFLCMGAIFYVMKG